MSRDYTCKEVHEKLYSFYREVYPVDDYEKEIVEIEHKEQPMRVLLIPASRFSNCDYCGKKSCDGCQLPFEEKKFGEVIPENDQKVEIELYWRKK